MAADTILIEQRAKSDCAICCLAMFTGRPYEEVIEAVGDAYKPDQGMWGTSTALNRLGFNDDFHAGQPIGQFVCRHRGWEISPEFFRTLAWGRRALFSVPSLNIKDGSHMIYWDGRKVWDPSTKQKYEKFDQLLPTELVLFQEAG